MAPFHRYSLFNVLLIASQRPAATRVAGYHKWREFGRFVKKGAKGIFILAPILAKKTAEQDSVEEDTKLGTLVHLCFLVHGDGESIGGFYSTMDGVLNLIGNDLSWAQPVVEETAPAEKENEVIN